MDDVETAEVGLDRNLLASCDRRSDGDRAAEKSLALLNMPAGRNRDLGYTLEILGLRSDYDIHVFGATHYPPGIHGEAAHHDELRLCLRQAPQQLVEGWLAQLRRAAPVNRISL